MLNTYWEGEDSVGSAKLPTSNCERQNNVRTFMMMLLPRNFTELMTAIQLVDLSDDGESFYRVFFGRMSQLGKYAGKPDRILLFFLKQIYLWPV